MRCFWAMPRPAAQALVVLFLASFVSSGALGNWFWENDDDSAARERRQLEAVDKVSMRSLRLRQTFGHETVAGQWLSKVRCSILEQSVLTSFYRSDEKYCYEIAYGHFWDCAERCLQVEFPWLLDMVSILPTMLLDHGIWREPAVLSISRRSWTVMDAADLATWLQHGSYWAWHPIDLSELRFSGEEKPLPKCVGYLSKDRRLDYRSSTISELETGLVDDLLNAIASNASSLAIEHLHVSVTPHDNYWPTERTLKPQHLVSAFTFERLTTSLASAPHLQDVSISWESDSQSSVEAASNVEAITARLAKNTSIRKLSIFRTGGDCGFDSGPLAAFTRAASVRGGWRRLESLSITTRDCQSDGTNSETKTKSKTSADELQAFKSLFEHMPALRQLHLEYRDNAALGLYGCALGSYGVRGLRERGRLTPENELVTPIGDIVRQVPNRVSVTMKANIIGAAGVVRMATLAPLSDASSNGYAVVASVSNLRSLIGRELLQNTLALTIVRTFAKNPFTIWFEEAGHAMFEVPVKLLSNLERLAIDSRWTGDYGNDIVAGLPSLIGIRLRALMVHTIRSVNDAGWNGLQGLLDAGRDISVVELGISIPSSTTTEVEDRLERLAVTLSEMPRLKHLRLFLTDERADYGGRRANAMSAIFKVVPFARITVLKSGDFSLRGHQPFDRFGDPVGWRLNLTAAVPSTPFFPSPLQFYTGASDKWYARGQA